MLEDIKTKKSKRKIVVKMSNTSFSSVSQKRLVNSQISKHSNKDPNQQIVVQQIVQHLNKKHMLYKEKVKAFLEKKTKKRF